MQELFTALTRAVEGSVPIALGASLVWGILSILLSPGHLASIPLIVGFIGQQGRMSARRACGISALFATGILITLGVIGAITAAAGRMLGDVGRYGDYFVAAIFFVVGLHLVGVIPMPRTLRLRRGIRNPPVAWAPPCRYPLRPLGGGRRHARTPVQGTEGEEKQMATCKFRDVKVGEAILFNNEVWLVFSRHEQTRGNLRTYWQVKLKHLERGNVFEQRFSPDDNVERVILSREEYDFSYQDGDQLVFMHPTTFDQINVSQNLVPDEQRRLLIPNTHMNLLKIGEKVVQVEMPQMVTVLVTDAAEGARGDTATNVTKLVTIETGAQVRVPGYIKKGDKVKIRVEDGEFLGRAT